MPYANQSAMTIGKYRLIAELGHGGMSDVYLAVVKGMGGGRKLFVIKQLRANLAEDEAFLTKFLDEARLAAKLSHRNVVATHEVGEDDGRYYIAMEYLDGQPLKRVIHRAKARFGLDLHLRVMLDVLRGLHHAHELRDYDGTPLGVVHRDVSPHNIFVTYSGDVKVVDFGVAKALDSVTETSAGVMKGKLAYMAPEQARGAEVDQRADVFSVGVLLWESIARKRMWAGQNSARIAERLVHGLIPDLREEAPDAPDDLVGIVRRALSADVSERYQSAQEMHDHLASHVELAGIRVSAEDLGHRVAHVFDDERILMQTIIERQLRRVLAARADDDSMVGMVTLGRMTTSSSARTPTTGGDESDEEKERDSAAGRCRRGAGPGGKLMVGAGLAVTLIATGGLTGWVWSRAEPNESVAAGPPPSSVSATSSDPAREPEPDTKPDTGSIHVQIRARPSHAKLYLDGTPLPSNPFDDERPEDAEVHHVRAEAPGFLHATRKVRFNADVVVDLDLARTPVDAASLPTRTVAARSASGRPPAPPGSVPPVEPTKRPIDTHDPWSP